MKAKIKIKNGYWTYNGVVVKNCPFPIQTLVASFIKTQVFDTEVKAVEVSKSTDLIIDSNIFGMPNFIAV